MTSFTVCASGTLLSSRYIHRLWSFASAASSLVTTACTNARASCPDAVAGVTVEALMRITSRRAERYSCRHIGLEERIATVVKLDADHSRFGRSASESNGAVAF